jgi:hypothetical protein
VDKTISSPEDQLNEFPEHEIQDWGNLFNIRSANEWLEEAKKRPEPKALFGDFWLEGELSILFSDTNRGKSTLAMQIAEAIARGKKMPPFETAPAAQKVLYFDFELSENSSSCAIPTRTKTARAGITVSRTTCCARNVRYTTSFRPATKAWRSLSRSRSPRCCERPPRVS